jgi:hypothetical protein
MVTLDEKKDVDSYMTHSGCALTMFLTPEQLKELQLLKVEEKEKGEGD